MNKTGEICQTTGTYKCNAHPTTTKKFDKGDKFTSCDPKDGINKDHGTTWILVK